MANPVPGFTRSYLVQKSDDNGTDKGIVKIDQYVNPKDGERGQRRVRDQVESQCFHNWRKTGIHHHIIFEGDPWQASELLEGRDGIPF